MSVEEELPPYNFEGEPEETEEKPTTTEGQKEANQKKGYVAIHSSGFRDFLLKPELLRAVVSCGFEHPSEVQHECIPQAILGMDVICQAKSGMGKTAVFVLAVLQQLEPVKDQVQCVVLGHTRELAYQIANEFTRFSKFLPDVKTSVFYGGINLSVNKQLLETETPNIVVGTPGRVLQLAKSKLLDLSKVRHFVVDECDKVLQSVEMRSQVQEIFMKTPHDKQVMMFSATLSKEMRTVAKKFMHNPMEIYVDDESKLTLHGLQQYYVKVTENQKNKKLMDLLDNLEFNQVVIFVRSVKRANELSKLLEESMFPSICVHSDLTQEDRILRYKNFKDFKHRILVSTDIFGRGIDIQRVNIVINYDMPDGADTYLHRVGRAGRFGTKGLGISFVNPESKQEIEKEAKTSRSQYVRLPDEDVLEDIQKRFTVKIKEMPAQIDVATYMSTQ